MRESILAPLYNVDRFLRFELVRTLQRGGTLEPSKDWSDVAKGYEQLLKRRGELPRGLWAIIELAFEELTATLNSVANLFRELPAEKTLPNFNEQAYLQEANARIDRARGDFKRRIEDAERLFSVEAPSPHPEPPAEMATSLITTPQAVSTRVLALPVTLYDRIIWLVKNNRFFLPVILIGGFIILLGNVTDSIDKMFKFYQSYLGSSPSNATQPHFPRAVPKASDAQPLATEDAPKAARP